MPSPAACSSDVWPNLGSANTLAIKIYLKGADLYCFVFAVAPAPTWGQARAQLCRRVGLGLGRS
eukprot:13030814-Alexandrium_andersonii.AAC.1